MKGFLQRKKSDAAEISVHSDKPQERVLAVFHKLTQVMISQMQPGMKRFMAEQAYDTFAPEINETMRNMSEEQVAEWLETSRELFARISSIIEDGLTEETAVLGGVVLGEQTANHD